MVRLSEKASATAASLALLSINAASLSRIRDGLEQAEEIGPSFNGEFGPSMSFDFHFDEELFTSRAAEGSTLLAMHRVCEKHFNACWNDKHHVWLPGTRCKKGAVVCPAVMCTSWLEANCMKFEKECPVVNEMCGFQQPPKVESNESGMNGLYDAAAEEPMVFLHIPKTAGTAIENAGIAHNVRWGRHRMYYFGMMAMPDGLYCTTHHVPPRHLPKVMASIYEESEVFCVARHPYERAVSEYKYLLAVPWGRDKPGLLTYPACTAEGLNHFLLTALKMVGEGQRFVNDCHMLPQAEFIADKEHRWCKDVLLFEEMPKSFDALMERKGYNIRLDHSENESGECKGLTRDDLNATTLHMLNRIYDEDFRRLDYQKTKPSSSNASVARMTAAV